MTAGGPTLSSAKLHSLVEVGGQPVHDDVEGVMEGEVVDHDGPHSRVGHHADPGGRTRPPLMLLLLMMMLRLAVP